MATSTSPGELPHRTATGPLVFCRVLQGLKKQKTRQTGVPTKVGEFLYRYIGIFQIPPRGQGAVCVFFCFKPGVHVTLCKEERTQNPCCFLRSIHITFAKWWSTVGDIIAEINAGLTVVCPVYVELLLCVLSVYNTARADRL